jgi:hypothetical protein
MSEIHLILSNQSIRNTTIACDSLGIHYEVSKQDDIIQVKRWNSKADDSVLIAEFKLSIFSKDVIRFSPDEEWMPVTDFMPRSGNIFTT